MIKSNRMYLFLVIKYICLPIEYIGLAIKCNSDLKPIYICR